MESDMARSSAEQVVDVGQRLRASNRRTAWILSSIAAVFFAGIIATRWVGGGTVGIGVMGTAVLLFLVVAIGRNLRQTDERAEESVGPNDASARDRADSDARQADLSKASREAPDE
jgi:hypothetical protein